MIVNSHPRWAYLVLKLLIYLGVNLTYKLATHPRAAAASLGPLLAADGAHDSPDEAAERLERVDDADGVVAAQVVHALREQPVQIRPSAAGVGGQGFCADLLWNS